MKEKERSQFFIVETQLLVQSYEENVNNMDLILEKRFSKKDSLFFAQYSNVKVLFFCGSRIYVNEIKMYWQIQNFWSCMVTPRSIGGRANRRRARLEGFGDGTIENPLNLKEIKIKIQKFKNHKNNQN